MQLNHEERTVPSPDTVASPARSDYRSRARNAEIDLEYVKRHRFTNGWKGSIFEDFEQARAMVRGKNEALVVVDGRLRGSLALDRFAIEKIFPDLVEAFDHLTSMKNEKDRSFDAESDLIVLYAEDPQPVYHGQPVKGFWVRRVAGTCHFRQFPPAEDPRLETKAFGSRGE